VPSSAATISLMTEAMSRSRSSSRPVPVAGAKGHRNQAGAQRIVRAGPSSPPNADKLRYEMYLVFSGPWPWLYGRTLAHGHIAA
jgi:hypothetical protein